MLITNVPIKCTKTDCFEDASDVLAESGLQSNQILQQQQDNTTTGEKGPTGQPLESERAELKVRLEETREILRMALSNQFVKAINLCADR